MQTFAIIQIDGHLGADQRLEPLCGEMQELGLRLSGIHWIAGDFQSLVDLLYHLSARTTHVVVLGEESGSLQLAMSALAAWSEAPLAPLNPAPVPGERFMAPTGSAFFGAPHGGIIRTRNAYTAVGGAAQMEHALRTAIAR